MDLQVRDDVERNRFEGFLDGELVAVADYRVDESQMDIFHTEVRPERRGQGLGDQLVEAALEGARERQLRVRPTCWFVAKYIDEHDEWADLVRVPGAGQDRA
jgi:predicted GNAT family acetyltransferase